MRTIRVVLASLAAVATLALAACSGSIGSDGVQVSTSPLPTVSLPSGVPTSGAEGKAWADFLAELVAKGFAPKPVPGNKPKATAAIGGEITATFERAMTEEHGFTLVALTKNGQSVMNDDTPKNSPDIISLTAWRKLNGH